MNSGSKKKFSQLRILVLGYIVRGPMGGMAWHHLQYVLGLAKLGHEVYFLEDSGDDPWACYDPTRNVTDDNSSYGLQFLAQLLERVGLGDRWAYYDALATRWYGPAGNKVPSLCSSADFVLNLSGSNPLRPWTLKVPVRVYIDTDPVFTQVRHLSDSARLERASRHTAFFSFGENIEHGTATVPADGFAWQPTRQPVVLDVWPVTPGPDSGRYTTVMQWDKTIQSVPLQYEGRHYGKKADSFGPYMDLPKQCAAQFELALGGKVAPREELRRKGWAIRNPLEVTRDAWTYQQYIQQSKGEFSIAKEAYVASNCGWFSERSAAYLASGRPVLTQDTGFSNWLPTGTGILAFNNCEEALDGIQEVSSRYEVHCKKAREVAQEYFDARKVLSRLIESITCPTSPSALNIGERHP